MPEQHKRPDGDSRQSSRPRFFVAIIIMLAGLVILMMILLFIAD